jgi:hypothetical protein
MTDAGTPLAAVNAVLSEVIDVVREVKQARWQTPPALALRDELDRLFDDARAWARTLVEEDDAHGVSALASIPSVAGRAPPRAWPPDATAATVRDILGEHLDRLREHVTAALAEQNDEQVRTALAEVERGALAHRDALDAL